MLAGVAVPEHAAQPKTFAEALVLPMDAPAPSLNRPGEPESGSRIAESPRPSARRAALETARPVAAYGCGSSGSDRARAVAAGIALPRATAGSEATGVIDPDAVEQKVVRVVLGHGWPDLTECDARWRTGALGLLGHHAGDVITGGDSCGTGDCLHAGIPAIPDAGSGYITSTSSVIWPRTARVAADVAAEQVVWLAEVSLAEDSTKRGIRVDAVAPGAIQSENLEIWFSQVPGMEEALRCAPLRRGPPSQ
jgi:NAD(P)-dependent dehydrogenase (short-subunit alcohol dehydrogenase family)